MAKERIRKKKPKTKREEAQVEDAKSINKTELLHDLDDILDEIDEVLEENAEEFVNSYRQIGGE